MITVILNCFKRQHNLERQINSVLKQTIKPEKIMIWNNGLNIDIAKYNHAKICVANHSENLGVWSRFAYALNAETEYVCILDDDTNPGIKFFESCLNHMNDEPALMGARGLRFMSASNYYPSIAFGWDSPNEKIEIVDIVGHAWFFKREWLSSFWRELPPIGANKIVGEDIHFSFMLQKYLKIKTKVPPHPLLEKELWGSEPEIALALGKSEVAISQASNSTVRFNKALKYNTKKGFILYKDQSYNNIEKYTYIPYINKLSFLKRIIKKSPTATKFSKKIINRFAKKKIYF